MGQSVGISGDMKYDWEVTEKFPHNIILSGNLTHKAESAISTLNYLYSSQSRWIPSQSQGHLSNVELVPVLTINRWELSKSSEHSQIHILGRGGR